MISFNSRHLHKTNVKTYNHQVRIPHHTWEIKYKSKTTVIYVYVYIYIYIYIYIFKEIKIPVSSNSFRRCLFQLHYSHKTNTTKTYTI